MTKVNSTVGTVLVGRFCAEDVFFFAMLSTLYTLFRCNPLECLYFITNDLLKHWNGKFFESTTLTTIGYTLQLSHTTGDPCLNPSTLHDLMVFNLNGVHRIVVKYCHCIASADSGAHSVSRHAQLLQAHWFPVTIVWLLTLRARGHLTEGYMLITLWFFKQFVHTFPRGDMLITF